jgi:hypothetical protein
MTILIQYMTRLRVRPRPINQPGALSLASLVAKNDFRCSSLRSISVFRHETRDGGIVRYNALYRAEIA